MIKIAMACAGLAVHLGCLYLVRRGFRKATDASGDETARMQRPVSVIVAARNESDNLPRLLDAVRRQTHPEFECIVVDDGSTDATAEVVQSVSASDPRIRLVSVTEPRHPRKKNALSVGISRAENEILVFTDADCVPPPAWIETLCRHHGTVPGVVAGFSPYYPSGTMLNRFIRYETLITAFLTAGAIGLGKPFMAVGRNFSYHRSVFERIGGFQHSIRSLSGDDDLLIQEAARHPDIEISYVADPAGAVYSRPPRTWKKWLRQKRRHTSAGRYYDRRTQAALSLFHLSNLLVWFAPLYAGWPGAAVLAVKLGAGFLIVAPAARKLGQRSALKAYPVYDAVYALYNVLVAPAGVLLKPRKW